MRRREFIGLVGGAVVASPLTVSAQEPARMRHVSVLMPQAEGDPQGELRAKAFEQELEKLGWITGRNVRIEYRWTAGDAQRNQAFAREIVASRPDVIVGANTPTVAALVAETRAIPIVFVVVSDPVGSGFVESLARPGGNVTGFAMAEAPLAGKWLELLKEVAPRVTRVALMFNPETAPGGGAFYFHSLEAAAVSMRVKPVEARVTNDAEIQRISAELAAKPGSGLIVSPDNFTAVHRALIIAMAARYQLPAVYPYRYFSAGGGLISYGIDLLDLHRRAATYVDRILKGAKPAELPVQLPTKYELVINMKTAKALGLKVPLRLQQVADEVIE